MIEKIRLFFNGIDKLNYYLAKFFSWSIVFLVLTLVYEVIMRYIFKNPTQWSYDVTYMINSMFVVFGYAYTHQIEGHVRIDLIKTKLSKRLQALLDILFSLLLLFPSCLLMIRVMVPHLQMSWGLKERAMTGTWLPPVYPFKTWILLGIILFTLQGVSQLIKDLTILFNGEQSNER